ncbi:hypothetical protein K438DRAFT_1647533 [Mycena galopus ATCC 62051]|nr:hypothetical protein K438DRAFT_1647533 [Mycena galopus ATCC 62051]
MAGPCDTFLLQEGPRKPVTVNWRDIQATIHARPNVDKDSIITENTNSLDITTLDPVDPANDGLDWLNEGRPDLRTSAKDKFDLAAEFDIKQYLHILADSIEGMAETSEAGTSDRECGSESNRASLKAVADSAAPKEDEWSSWGA